MQHALAMRCIMNFKWSKFPVCAQIAEIEFRSAALNITYFCLHF